MTWPVDHVLAKNVNFRVKKKKPEKLPGSIISASWLVNLYSINV